MNRKNVLVMSAISLLSISVIGGVLLSKNTNFLKVSGDPVLYTITLTKSNVKNVVSDTGYTTFDLVGRNGSNTKDFTVSSCNINAGSATAGGDHVFTASLGSGYYLGVSMPFEVVGVGELTDFYMVGTVNGETNNKFHNDDWISYDDETNKYYISVYVDNYASGTSPLAVTSIVIDTIIIQYTCEA